MHRPALLMLFAIACTPRAEPGSPPGPPPAEEWSCSDDSDCLLQSREMLGCCTQCPELEAMSRAQADHIASLCGLHQGGETCPPMPEAECTPQDPGPWRAVCSDGACVKVRE